MPEGRAWDPIMELVRTSQPGLVLVSAAVLADRLIKMRTLSEAKAKRIFNGPLGRLAAKIDVAYAFELIDDDLYEDLTAIKDIRNEFAHSVTQVSFDSLEVLKVMKKFRGWSDKDVEHAAFHFFNERVKSCLEQINAKQQQGLFAMHCAISRLGTEQPIWHPFLKVPNDMRLGFRDRDRQRLPFGRPEVDDVGAVVLRAMDHECGSGRSPEPPH
jgi:hypothetical protein